MKNIDRILHALQTEKRVLCDDCLSQIANVSPRQQINAIANSLLLSGRIIRKKDIPCDACERYKQCSVCLDTELVTSAEFFAASATQQVAESEIRPAAMESGRSSIRKEINLSRPWYWEGNVQIVLRDFLIRQGWEISHFANTERKEVGVDLGATKMSQELLFEIKGYPTTVYDYGPNRGRPKPTPPNSQARQWYSHALLGVLRLKEKFPEKNVALCFPDFLVYRRLIEGTKSSLRILAVSVYVVAENGEVVNLNGEIS